MTKEQAIDIIKCLAWHYRPDEENIEQAIKALEQQPSDTCEYNRGYRDGYDKGNLNGYELRKAEEKKSDDCVSRASVKELFQEGCVMGMYDFLGIDDLPPVTPTHGTCKDCKYNVKDKRTTTMCDLGHRFYMREPSTFYCADFEKRGSKVGWSSLENVREKVERGNSDGSN